MRMIDQLVKVLSRILFNKQKGYYREAFNDIDTALKKMLGLDYNLINSLSGNDIITLLDFSKDDSSFTIRCIVIAKFLKENGEIKELSGNDDSDYNYDYQKALRLFLEGILRNNNKDFSISEFYPDIKELAEKLGNNIPSDIKILLTNFYKQTGKFI